MQIENEFTESSPADNLGKIQKNVLDILKYLNFVSLQIRQVTDKDKRNIRVIKRDISHIYQNFNMLTDIIDGVGDFEPKNVALAPKRKLKDDGDDFDFNG